MVDTGSSCSIWPLRLVSNKPKKSCISLHAVNLSTIDTYGQVSLTLNFNLHRNFHWVFIIADLPYWVGLGRRSQWFGHVRFALAVICTHSIVIGSVYVFKLRTFVVSLRHFLLKYFGWTLNCSTWESFNNRSSTVCVYIYIMCVCLCKTRVLIIMWLNLIDLTLLSEVIRTMSCWISHKELPHLIFTFSFFYCFLLSLSLSLFHSSLPWSLSLYHPSSPFNSFCLFISTLSLVTLIHFPLFLLYLPFFFSY